MPNLPLKPNLKHYGGSKENLQRKNAESNKTAIKVAEHVNVLIANDPGEMQQYLFALLAIDLGLTADQVRAAISDGGHNGITIRITPADREALARYKTRA
jgi:hypothetical protein